MNFEKHKREDGTINLQDVFDDAFSLEEAEDFMATPRRLENARTFLADVQALQPIKSRQTAAVAVAFAKHIANAER